LPAGKSQRHPGHPAFDSRIQRDVNIYAERDAFTAGTGED